VKSLVAFPQVLASMDEKLEWTERLGDAFLGQQAQVMDSVQGLRQRAYAAGNLRSGDQYRVEERGQTIIVESPSPEVVYVPYYDPFVVYGAWWWPAYRPVYWAPWPGYISYAGYPGGFRWSLGITIGTGFFFGACDWGHRNVRIIDARPFYFRGPVITQVHNNVTNVWVHVPDHRRGVPYRHPWVREKFQSTTVIRPDGRREVRPGHVPERRFLEPQQPAPRKGQGDDNNNKWRRVDQGVSAPVPVERHPDRNVPFVVPEHRVPNGEPNKKGQPHEGNREGQPKQSGGVATPAPQPQPEKMTRPGHEPRPQVVQEAEPRPEGRAPKFHPQQGNGNGNGNGQEWNDGRAPKFHGRD
jgi:hypothetical protein